MPVSIENVTGICNDCGKEISGTITMEAGENGPIRVLASGSLVVEGSEHHDDPESRDSGREHGSFVLNVEEFGRVKTIGIITAAAGETYAAMMVIDEELRRKLDDESYSIRGERGI